MKALKVIEEGVARGDYAKFEARSKISVQDSEPEA